MMRSTTRMVSIFVTIGFCASMKTGPEATNSVANLTQVFYEGQLVKHLRAEQICGLPGQEAIFWVEGGKLRHIPTLGTLNSLFGGTGYSHTNLSLFPCGDPITNGATLALPIDGAAVYFVSNGIKRHVSSPTAMAVYSFSQGTVYHVPSILLNCFPNGPAI